MDESAWRAFSAVSRLQLPSCNTQAAKKIAIYSDSRISAVGGKLEKNDENCQASLWHFCSFWTSIERFIVVNTDAHLC